MNQVNKIEANNRFIKVTHPKGVRLTISLYRLSKDRNDPNFLIK